MRKLLSLFVLALVFTASASASTIQQKLDASASFIAGKPVTETCYRSQAAWNAYAKANGYSGSSVLALSIPGGNTNRYSPEVCLIINTVATLGLKEVPAREVGEAIMVLAHEPELSYFPYVDGVDSQAEACGPMFYAEVAHTVFGVAYHTIAMRKLVAAALVWHNAEAKALGASICPR